MMSLLILPGVVLLCVCFTYASAVSSSQASCTSHWDPALCCEVWPDGKPEEHQEQTCGMKPGEKASWSDAGYGFTPMATEDYQNIPTERTELCPLDEAGHLGHSVHAGQATRWIVRNNATSSVEVNWLDGDGKEIAAGGKEKIVLSPGQTGYINTREGHLFAVREQKADGTGRLLALHRVGMIAVRNDAGVPCSADGPFHQIKRNPEGCPLDCNYLNRGFRNEVGCPVNVFFWNGTHDDFVFQLGSRRSGEDAWLWDTAYHYEISYNTHRFRARLPHPTNPALGRHVSPLSLHAYFCSGAIAFFSFLVLLRSLRSLFLSRFQTCVRGADPPHGRPALPRRAGPAAQGAASRGRDHRHRGHAGAGRGHDDDRDVQRDARAAHGGRDHHERTTGSVHVQTTRGGTDRRRFCDLVACRLYFPFLFLLPPGESEGRGRPRSPSMTCSEI